MHYMQDVGGVLREQMALVSGSNNVRFRSEDLNGKSWSGSWEAHAMRCIDL